MNNRHKGELSLLFAAALYGMFGILARLISFDIPIFFQAWVRNLFATIFLGVLVLISRNWKTIKTHDIKWFFLRTVCGFISFVTLFTAFTGIDIGTAYFVFYAATVISGFAAGKLFFGEKFGMNAVIPLILSMIGLSLIFTSHFDPARTKYIILAFASGIFLPGWNVFSKKISKAYSNLQCNFIDSIFATLLPFIASVILHEQWSQITLSPVWIEIFLLGLLFVTVGFFIVYGFSHVSAQEGTLILLVQVIAGLIFAYFFFQEVISLQSMVGGGLILLAIIFRIRKYAI